MSVTVKVEGLEKLERDMNARLRKIEGFSAKAFTDVVLHMTGEAVRDAPVETGDLRGSGHADINGETIVKGTSSGDITMANTANPAKKYEGEIAIEQEYALAQHDRLDFNHPKGGKAKYLEDAVKRNFERSLKHLKDSTDEAVK